MATKKSHKAKKTNRRPIEGKKKKDQNAPLRSPRGMDDVLPIEQPWWDRVRRVAGDLASLYSFDRIDTPLLESKQLFTRGIGEVTDIVEKEMYTLRTKGGDHLALRPEGTAPVVRAFIEHGMSKWTQPVKLFYEGPMFRHENPQAGRWRQFTHIGYEILGGVNDPVYDAQIITVFNRLFRILKIDNVSLKLNSIGCRVCRPFYKKQLNDYYRRRVKNLCRNCVRRLETNPLRLLDCKNEECVKLKEGAPNLFDKLCAVCSRHFKDVLEYLEELGIDYSLDNNLVRGLDYYSRTVFEFMMSGDGEHFGSVGGGGRYDYLFEELGGHLTPAVGGAVSFERLIAVMKLQNIKLPQRGHKTVFVVHVGDTSKKKALALVEQLRAAGISVLESLGKESLKAQLRAADRESSFLALILGQKEMYEENVIIRDLKSGVQETIPLQKVIDEIKKRFKES